MRSTSRSRWSRRLTLAGAAVGLADTAALLRRPHFGITGDFIRANPDGTLSINATGTQSAMTPAPYWLLGALFPNYTWPPCTESQEILSSPCPVLFLDSAFLIEGFVGADARASGRRDQRNRKISMSQLRQEQETGLLPSQS